METLNNSNTAESAGAGDSLGFVAAENNGILIDTTSGIPESEQREILDGIENITAKNRLSLSEEQKNLFVKGKIRAKRGGIRFPLIVNIAAVLLLAGAFFILYSLHDKEVAQIREGRAVYNSAERALIQEIRRETARELEEKEREISLITGKLSGVDAELQELHSSNQELTAEQRETEMELQRRQEEYRSSLGLLQNERAQLLESSRAREAGLRAQLEERTRELTAVTEQGNAARNELERLSSDQEKAAAIEAQLSARYATAATQIFMDKLSEAKDSLAKMREFLNTPSFQNIRTFQSRKELYLASVDTLKEMIDKTEESKGALASTLQAQAAENAEYEKQLADLQGQNASREEEAAKLGRDLRASQNSLTTLQKQLEDQRQTLNERNGTITTLQSERSALTQRITEQDNRINELNGQITTQEADITKLNSDLTSLRQAIQALQPLTQ
ncbi:hypothetical protein AGMMS50268_25400 [Spirochaetia bacterium]|nr:hypothetical protein AGMMS50268_25400 [Spirochaetia bacterium]